MGAATSHRERKKARTRDALAGVAAELIRTQGYDGTTIEQIAEQAGVCRRTFFRYFPVKEAVVFPKNGERLERFSELLRAGAKRDRPFEAVRRACRALVDEFAQHRKELILQHRLVETSPALLTYERELDRAWEAALADALRGRARSETARRRARILAGATMGAIRATLQEWYATGAKADLSKLAEEAMELLARGVDPRAPTTRDSRDRS